MTKLMRRGTYLCVSGTLVVGVVAATAWTFSGPTLRAAEARKVETEADPALDRARAQVKMLDELYKNAVVSITKRYAEGPPAIKVAMDLFKAMEASGWHEAKLVDASGAPQNEANLPQTPFETRAAKAMNEGKPYYEEVRGEGTERRLLAATVVPAVLKRCASCHGAKEGDLLGFIRYDVPIE